MKHVVVIGLIIPEPASTAAGHRMMQLLQLFADWGYTISFLTGANNIEYSEKLDVQKIEINNDSFDSKIKELQPDVVLFDRYITEEQFGWRVSEQCPGAIKILDTEDLHFLREGRRKAFIEQRAITDADLINDIFSREVAAILRCDLSLIISEFEYNLLTETYKLSPDLLFYIPFLTEQVIPSDIPFEDRNHFVSIGNFLHEPNWRTVLKLKSIWKGIRKKLPTAELHIYGAYTSKKVLDLHQEKDGFLVKGRAESVADLFGKAKVLLAPIPFGAGLKGKLWESMLYGLPSVTSSIGAEAMHGDLQYSGFVADDDTDFTEKSIELYTNMDTWQKAQENGYKLQELLFSKALYSDSLKSVVNNLYLTLESHRIKNYMGKILQHQFLQSTKYMSRWIEEKNKNK